MEMVEFPARTMARILSGEHLRALAVVIVIAGALREEPLLGTVEVLVHQVGAQALHLGPEIVELLALGVRAAGTDDLDVRIRGADGLHERLQVLRIERIPLLVADADVLEVERVLELAREAAAQDRKRLAADFLRKLEELEKAQAVALVIIREETVRESVFPAVLVDGAVLHRAHGVLPVIAGREIGSFHDTAAREAEDAGLEVRQGLRQVLPHAVAMAHPGVRREEGHVLKVHGLAVADEEDAEDRLLQRRIGFQDHLILFPLLAGNLQGLLADELVLAHRGGVHQFDPQFRGAAVRDAGPDSRPVHLWGWPGSTRRT